jgi:hypothetical protein
MAEYRDQIYNKEKVVVDGTQKAWCWRKVS